MHPYADEYNRIRLAPLKYGTPDFDKEYNYLCGFLDAQDRISRDNDKDEDVLDGWRQMGYAVAVKAELRPYFRMRDIIEADDTALVNYQKDFYKIDFQTMLERPDVPFIWILRDLGTHFYRMFPGEGECGQNIAECVKTFGVDHIRYMGYYDPAVGEFKQLDPAKPWQEQV